MVDSWVNKPSPIQAMQFVGEETDLMGVFSWVVDESDEFTEAVLSLEMGGNLLISRTEDESNEIYSVGYGAYVILGQDGKFYKMDPETFEALYMKEEV